MALNDNAGVFTSQIDQSAQAASVLPGALFSCAPIESQRYFVNKPYLVTKGAAELRSVFFVNGKNYRKWGVTAHEIEVYLQASSPCWVIRAGDPTWLISSGLVALGTVPLFAASGKAYAINDAVNVTGSYFKALVAIKPVTATGTIELLLNPTDGTTVTISDSIAPPNSVTFEFDDDTIVTPGNIAVPIGINLASSLGALKLAIQTVITAGTLKLTVASNLIDTLTLTNPLGGLNGNFTIVTSNVLDITPTGFTGGLDIPTPVAGLTWASILLPEAQTLIAQTVTPSGILQANIETFPILNPDTYLGRFIARGEGDWGNQIYIQAVKSNKVYAGVTPGTVSTIAVYYGNNLNFNDINNPVLPVETFDVTRNPADTDENGISLYYQAKINASSNYISAIDNFVLANEAYQMNFPITQLSGGTPADGSHPTAAQHLTAFKTVMDFPDSYDIYIPFNPAYAMNFVDFAAAVIPYGNAFGSSGVSYADSQLTSSDLATLRRTVYSSSDWHVGGPLARWVRITEEESGNKVWVSEAGFKARNIAQDFLNGNFFKAAAGLRRGSIAGADAVSYIDSGSDRVILSKVQMNSTKQTSTGLFLWDTLTSQSFLSSYSEETTALAHIAIARACVNSLMGFVFEFNDVDTVNQISAILIKIGNQMIANQGLNAFSVSSENNVLGSPTITMSFRAQFKGIAKYIEVQIIAVPSTGTLTAV